MARRDLPSLSLLQTFELAARRLSFTEAAEELCITQSAVSRQIRSLEEQLGVPLFKRLHRALELTPEGKTLFETVARNLDDLEVSIREIQVVKSFPQLTVGTSVSFAYFWLMPRLAKFSEAHPEIDLRILASDQALDLAKGTADIGVLYGNGQWPGFKSDLLFGEEVYPVCGPAYLEQDHKLATSADFLEETLLHLDSGGNIWGGVDWQVWLKTHGVTDLPTRRGIRLNNYPMIIQAALGNRGVALGWSYIVDEMVDQGLLIKPLDLNLKTENGYYLVSSKEASPQSAIAAFRNWILEEVRQVHTTKR